MSSLSLLDSPPRTGVSGTVTATCQCCVLQQLTAEATAAAEPRHCAQRPRRGRDDD